MVLGRSGWSRHAVGVSTALGIKEDGQCSEGINAGNRIGEGASRLAEALRHCIGQYHRRKTSVFQGASLPSRCSSWARRDRWCRYAVEKRPTKHLPSVNATLHPRSVGSQAVGVNSFSLAPVGQEFKAGACRAVIGAAGKRQNGPSRLGLTRDRDRPLDSSGSARGSRTPAAALKEPYPNR